MKSRRGLFGNTTIRKEFQQEPVVGITGEESAETVWPNNERKPKLVLKYEKRGRRFLTLVGKMQR